MVDVTTKMWNLKKKKMVAELGSACRLLPPALVTISLGCKLLVEYLYNNIF
ncbi:conserved hypothetical protein [Ricinus communis]|uniref:Uncharacterized protein n=1 Tax=Ricinus communis TaxID=3988 RepID=B9S719_RICCO|nr:conserved hypothetical protein [Ricinus communis]